MRNVLWALVFTAMMVAQLTIMLAPVLIYAAFTATTGTVPNTIPWWIIIGLIVWMLFILGLIVTHLD